MSQLDTLTRKYSLMRKKEISKKISISRKINKKWKCGLRRGFCQLPDQVVGTERKKVKCCLARV